MKFQSHHAAAVIAAVVVSTSHAASDWIQFVDETSQRLVADPTVGANDFEQKYFAYGDLNNNGRIDVVIARKQPFNSPGRRANVLLMNEGIAEGHAIDGVLIDRTAEYASSGEDGSNGFLDATNDTSILMVDLNGNGWLDVVTSTTLSGDQPKYISHPRVYMNLGNDAHGNWQGLHNEHNRVPEFALEPRFIEVAAGDVTGNGAADLFFVYARSGAPQPAQHLKDRLLINDGSGFFADETAQRMLAEGSIADLSNAVEIADINDNGFNDIIKNRTDMNFHVGVSYNDSQNVGYFNAYETIVAGGNNTYVSVADLNNSGKLDLVVTDDGLDQYLLNQGVDRNGFAQFNAQQLTDSAGFTGKVVIADLSGNGWQDLFITDIHWDIGSCSGNSTARIYQNNADGTAVTFTKVTDAIPDAFLTRSFHAAALDVNNNGHTDLVIGRCEGTAVWMHEMPILGDLNGDGVVNVSDLLALLGAWGQCAGTCPADLNEDGIVNVSDLLILLANWG
jgi:hypothetical protein